MRRGRWGRGTRWALGLLIGLALTLGPVRAQSLVRDAEIERTLRRLMAPVFQGAGTDPDSVDLYILGSPSLNAFVAGGRNIFIHTGLLMRLATPGQIQAVLAHELGHINGGHLARRGIQSQKVGGAMALGVLLAIAAGVASGSGDAAAAVLTGGQAALNRSFLAFSRGEEASADQAGLSYLDRAGINPSGMREVLEIFRGQEVLSGGSVDPYARTHPMSVDRMLLVEKRLAASPNRNRAPDPQLTFRVERMRAKLDGFLERPEKVLARAKDDSEFSLVRRAVAYHRLPDPARAIETVEALVRLRPDDAYYAELKGQILLETGRVEEALPVYRRAVKLAPDEPLIRASLARALVALNRLDYDREAIGLLERATREDPGNAVALRDLATAQARAGNEGLAALATAERFALQTNFRDVTRQARRAASLLPEGSPGWLKAQDLVLVAERMVARKKDRE